MKKLILSIAVIAVLLGTTSCGTICGGKISDCQKHKPATGHRAIRPAALLCDIFLDPIPVVGLVVDFCDGAMYKPCTDNAKK